MGQNIIPISRMEMGTWIPDSSGRDVHVSRAWLRSSTTGAIFIDSGDIPMSYSFSSPHVWGSCVTLGGQLGIFHLAQT